MLDNTEKPNSLNTLIDSLRRYLTLQIDYARLTAAEKMTILLSTIALAAILLVLGSMVLIFLSIGVGHLLATTVAAKMAYFYVAAFYAVVAVLLFIFRKKLIINPVTRFITRLFVKPPTQ